MVKRPFRKSFVRWDPHRENVQSTNPLPTGFFRPKIRFYSWPVKKMLRKDISVTNRKFMSELKPASWYNLRFRFGFVIQKQTLLSNMLRLDLDLTCYRATLSLKDLLGISRPDIWSQSLSTCCLMPYQQSPPLQSLPRVILIEIQWWTKAVFIYLIY